MQNPDVRLSREDRQPWSTFIQIWKWICLTRLDPKSKTGVRATLLSALLFFLFVLGTLGEIEWLRREGNFTAFDLFPVVAIAIIGVIFFLNRRGYFLFSVYTTIGILVFGVYAVFWLGDRSPDESNVLIYLILPILLAEYFLPFWGAVFVITTTVTAMLLISVSGAVINIFVLLCIFAILMNLFSTNQRQLDKEASDTLARSHTDLLAAYDETIIGWSAAMDLRDHETEGHSRRVAEMTVTLCRSLGVDEGEIVYIQRGALLHDIGKLGIPDHILHKTGPLTEAEWDIMRQHPTKALNILSGINYLRPSLEIPYSHHERWDGSGYPQRLNGEQIPQSARIFAVVDVWDALINDRPYRPAWTTNRALEYIREQAGKQFDPQVVRAFFKLMKQVFPLDVE